MRVLMTVLALSACAPEPEPPTQVAPAAASIPDPPPGTPQKMAEHYQDVVQIKDAVIAGDLAGVRAPARRLREVPGPIPESWRPYKIEEGELATRMLTAHNLRGAAQAAANLVNSCGECHAALAGGPRLAPPATPPAPIPHQARQHMLRHQWAADRMWDALVARDEDSWAAGAEVLADAPLLAEELTADVEVPEDLLELNQRVHQLGARARTTEAWPARAELYGEFLSTCATCHVSGCGDAGQASKRSRGRARRPSHGQRHAGERPSPRTLAGEEPALNGPRPPGSRSRVRRG